MGKNKRRQLDYYDEFHNVNISVDSQEEIDTFNWLNSAAKNNIIIDFEYQPKSFLLFNSVKYNDVNNKSKTLFRSHEYTADFKLVFSPKDHLTLAIEFKVPYNQLSNPRYEVYIDAKGTFNKTERAFGYNQKWLWQKTGIYVYKFIPKNFFKKFGVPKKSAMTSKTNKPRKIFLGYNIFENMIKEI